VTSYESTVGYTYDAGNRMTQAADSAGGTITEACDNLDRLTSETTPQGQISYGYDLCQLLLCCLPTSHPYPIKLRADHPDRDAPNLSRAPGAALFL
jgi:hypothetical protein